MKRGGRCLQAETLARKRAPLRQIERQPDDGDEGERVGDEQERRARIRRGQSVERGAENGSHRQDDAEERGRRHANDAGARERRRSSASGATHAISMSASTASADALLHSRQRSRAAEMSAGEMRAVASELAVGGADRERIVPDRLRAFPA